MNFATTSAGSKQWKISISRSQDLVTILFADEWSLTLCAFKPLSSPTERIVCSSCVLKLLQGAKTEAPENRNWQQYFECSRRRGSRKRVRLTTTTPWLIFAQWHRRTVTLKRPTTTTRRMRVAAVATARPATSEQDSQSTNWDQCYKHFFAVPTDIAFE